MSHEAIDAGTVKSRAVSGVRVLAARTAVSIVLRVVSSLCLARLLFPHDYGVFGVAAYIAGLGMFLSDIGLGGALVRQERTPTANESFTVFVSQQVITACVVAATIAFAPLLISIYHLSHAATTLLIAMAGGLFLSSLRIIPMLALERAMRFPAIARCELIENIVQTVSTIGLASLGCGAWSLAGGGLLRGIVGLVCVWSASPWRPQGQFEFRIVRRLARFGISFQLNALVPALMGGWLPLVVTRLLGIASLGLVNWAINIASVPMMICGVLMRVAFPAFSRLQSDPEALAQSLRASLRRVSAVLCLAVPVAIILCPAAIPVIFGPRWTSAIPLVQWLGLEAIVLTLNGLLGASQNATGYSGERLAVTLGAGLFRWGVGYFGVVHFGLLGIGPALLIAATFELAASTALVRRRLVRSCLSYMEVFGPLLIMGVMLAAAIGTGVLAAKDNVLLQTLTALVVFGALVALREIWTGGRSIINEWRGLAGMLRPVAE